MEHSIEDLMRCAQREVLMRKQVYPRQVYAGKMSQTQAAEEISRMEQIYEVFRILHKRGDLAEIMEWVALHE